MSHQQAPAEPIPKRRIHKRTLAIVFCFVILPWFLVAIPGKRSNALETAGSENVAYMHGWPFLHLVRTEAIVNKTRVNGEYVADRLPSQLELNELAQKSVPDQPSLKLNLRFGKTEVFTGKTIYANVYGNDFFGPSWPTVESGITGFWTEPFEWTQPDSGRYWEVQKLGLVCNLMFLALTILLAGWFVERKLARQRRMLKLSIGSLLLATTLVAIGSWIVREYSLYQKQRQQINYLVPEGRLDPARLSPGSNMSQPNFINANFKSRFAEIVSQLLNHGCLPFVDSGFFVALDGQNPGILTIHLYDKSLNPSKLAQAAAESPFSVNLKVMNYGRYSEKSLEDFEDVNLTDLYISFNFLAWIHSVYGDELKEMQARQLAGKRIFTPADMRVNIMADFPHLQRLSLGLCPTLDQESQLKSFCELESLEEVKLTGLSVKGIDFMLKTKEQWPRKVEFEFEDDVSDESKELLWQYFDSTYKFDS